MWLAGCDVDIDSLQTLGVRLVSQKWLVVSVHVVPERQGSFRSPSAPSTPVIITHI